MIYHFLSFVTLGVIVLTVGCAPQNDGSAVELSQITLPADARYPVIFEGQNPTVHEYLNQDKNVLKVATGSDGPFQFGVMGAIGGYYRTLRDNGAHRVAYLVVSLNDSQVSCTNQQLDSLLLNGTGSVKNFYSYASQGRLTVDGTVFPAISIPMSATQVKIADYVQFANSVLSQTTNLRIGYDRTVIIIPQNVAFDGTLGISSGIPGTWAIVRDYCDRSTFMSTLVSHELGHTFGLEHAGGNTGPYGDPGDVMGGAQTSAPLIPNALHMLQMGWVDKGQGEQFKTYSGGLIGALDDVNLSGPKIVKIEGQKPEFDQFISFRTGVGPFGEGLPDVLKNTLLIHDMGGDYYSVKEHTTRFNLHLGLGDGINFGNKTLIFSSVQAEGASLKTLSNVCTPKLSMAYDQAVYSFASSTTGRVKPKLTVTSIIDKPECAQVYTKLRFAKPIFRDSKAGIAYSEFNPDTNKNIVLSFALKPGESKTFTTELEKGLGISAPFSGSITIELIEAFGRQIVATHPLRYQN